MGGAACAQDYSGGGGGWPSASPLTTYLATQKIKNQAEDRLHERDREARDPQGAASRGWSAVGGCVLRLLRSCLCPSAKELLIVPKLDKESQD